MNLLPIFLALQLCRFATSLTCTVSNGNWYQIPTKDILQPTQLKTETGQVHNQGISNKQANHIQLSSNAHASTLSSETSQPKLLKQANALATSAQSNSTTEDISAKEKQIAKITQLQTDLNNNISELATIKKSSEEQNTQSKLLKENNTKLQEENNRLIQELAEAKQHLKITKESNEKLLKSSDDVKQALEKTEKEYNAKITQLQTDLDNRISELITITESSEEQNTQSKLLKENNTKLQEENNRLIQELAEAKQHLKITKESNEKLLKSSDDVKQALEKTEKEYNAKITQLQTDLDNKILELSQLTKLNTIQENAKSKQRNNKITITTITGVTVVTPLALIYLTALSTLAVAGITVAATLAAGLLVNKISSKLSEPNCTSIVLSEQQHV